MSSHSDPVLQANKNIQISPSIPENKEFMADKGMSFSFRYTTQEKTYKTLKNLDKKKTCQENDISVNIIKSHKDIFFTLFIITSITHRTVQFLTQN